MKMKKWFMALIMGMIMIVMAGCSTASDSEEMITLPVEVYNDTGVDIYELYASVVETNDWEEDILGSNILPAGSTFTINFTFPADKTRWDFKIVDAAGTSLEFYDLDFANCSITGATLLLEYDGSNGYATLN